MLMGSECQAVFFLSEPVEGLCSFRARAHRGSAIWTEWKSCVALKLWFLEWQVQVTPRWLGRGLQAPQLSQQIWQPLTRRGNALWPSLVLRELAVLKAFTKRGQSAQSCMLSLSSLSLAHVVLTHKHRYIKSRDLLFTQPRCQDTQNVTQGKY